MHARHALLFTRGEGCWYADGLIDFVCSNGGDLTAGQVFAYDPANETLTLVVESTDRSLLDAPDNITVGPDGRLYLCEDGSGGDNIVSVDHDGSLAILAQNIWSGSEWAGAWLLANRAHHVREHARRWPHVRDQGPVAPRRALSSGCMAPRACACRLGRPSTSRHVRFAPGGRAT